MSDDIKRKKYIKKESKEILLIYDMSDKIRFNLLKLHINQILKLEPKIKIILTFREQPTFLSERNDYVDLRVGRLKTADSIYLTRLFSMGPIDEIERQKSWWDLSYLKGMYSAEENILDCKGIPLMLIMLAFSLRSLPLNNIKIK
jgi:hypothetical protein